MSGILALLPMRGDGPANAITAIHLMELSPGSFRTFVVGTSYQLGNLVSSASSTIEATIGERFPLPPSHVGGKTVPRYRYGIVISIFMGCVFAYVIVLTFLGPEYKGKDMGVVSLLPWSQIACMSVTDQCL